MCSQGIAASSPSWSLGSLFPRTGWSFDSNRKTQTNHSIPRMISHSRFPGKSRHPKDPARSYSRAIHLEPKCVEGVTLGETRRPILLFETGLPTRYYIPKLDVRMDLLEPSIS